MDSNVTASAVACELGTSVPRVVRAAKRLGLDTRTRPGAFELTAEHAQRLREELGAVVNVPGLSTMEAVALAALARAPLGLPSARAVAGRAGISPTAASSAIKNLMRRGLVRQEATLRAAGRARHVVMLHADRDHPRYRELAAALRRVVPPRRPKESRVPARLAHLFWNTHPAQLDVTHGGPYIARRLLRTLDLDGLGWGARNLRPEDWRAASRARGLDPDVRALALNLAAHSEG